MKEYKVEGDTLFVREKVEIPRTSAGKCPFCGENVWVEPGMIYPIRRKYNIFEKRYEEEPCHRKCIKRQKKNE